MSSRPSRTTRSSAAASGAPSVAAPVTRSRKQSSLAPVVEGLSRPVTPSSSATRSRASVRPTTTAASKSISAPRPLVNRSRATSEVPPPIPSRPSSALGSRTGGRGPSIAIPGTVTPARTSLVRSSEVPEKRGLDGYDATTEPIKAFLRVRPGTSGSSGYIQVQNHTEVLMVPPATHRLNPSSSTYFGSSYNLASPALSGSADDSATLASSSTLYRFTRVFAPSNTFSSTDSQSTFFKETTLPLVHDFLKGENCLLFAYGPSGSGKTWTVQGGEGEKAGLLPRVIDVVWRSLHGKTAPAQARTAPTMMSTPNAKKSLHVPGLGLGPNPSVPLDDVPEAVSVEEGYEYSIFVSYAEIYNEKIYDLLDAPLPQPATSSSSTASHGVFSTGFGLAKGMFRSFSTVKRNALSLKPDKATGNKQVAGMQELPVHSALEAQAILDRGQQNRRVFSTLANRQSSRSHSVFTIKVVRTVKGASIDDPTKSFSSRFSIVDLAGSERVVNTQTTGDRLKEAGNINKSLMVLGQCMEVLRKNQERGKDRKPAIVPFRHSKLTELFQSFFVGDGKAVMIVNVNPHDTGFDENSHVMKFSAVAKGVMTVKDNKPVPLPAEVKEVEKLPPRVVRLSIVDGAEEEDVVYEEEEEDDEDEEQDEFVNALLEELSGMRVALYESELRAVMVESQTRSKVVREYEAKLLEMEQHYQTRLRDEAVEAENKLNAKLDILTRMQAQADEEEYGDETFEEEASRADTVEQEQPAVRDGDEADTSSASTVDSPLPPPKAAPPMLAPSPLSETRATSRKSPLAADPDSDFDYIENKSDEEFKAPQPRKQALASANSGNKAPGKPLARPARDSADTIDLDLENIALDQSVIIPVGGKAKKPTKKLGSQRVIDAEQIASYADEFGPPGHSKSGSASSRNSTLIGRR